MRTAILTALCAALAAAQEAPNTLTAGESAEGWQLLFDGKSLSGWTKRVTFDAGNTGDWQVANGAMVCGGTAASWISTDAEFGDYTLKLQFRGTAKVNSGVFLRSKKEGQPHVTGYELQIWDYQPQGYNTGSLVGSVKAPEVRIKPDEWNDYEITANGDHFVIVLNGKTLLDTKNAQHAAGVVGFQCQRGNPIEFRSIKLRPIKK